MHIDIRWAGAENFAADLPASWEDFRAEDSTSADFKLTISCETDAVPPVEEPELSWQERLAQYTKRMDVQKLPSGEWLLKDVKNPAILPIRCAPNYQSAAVYVPHREALCREGAADLLRIPLECEFVRRRMISFHAACVEKDGMAVCFTGDSGAGKSTRAEAWREALDARFISGDRPVLRLQKGGCLACGAPWDGKERIFRNAERPLKAILEVRRAEFTRLRRLTGEQARRTLIRQSFIPMWDTDLAAEAMANVYILSRRVPVYRLFCGPDADAAREVYGLLFHHPEQIGEEKTDMKIKEGFTLRHVVDEYMVMPTGENIKRFNGAVVLNEVSAFIWEQLEKSVCREDLLAQILAEFDVDEATAGADLDRLLDQLCEMDLLEE